MLIKNIFDFINDNKITRFIFSGGVGAFSQVIFFYMLSNYFNMWYFFATCVAFFFSIVISFLMQKFFTFKNKSKNIGFQFSKFSILALITFILNMLNMYILIDKLNMEHILAQLTSSIVIAFISYTVLNRFVFKETPYKA